MLNIFLDDLAGMGRVLVREIMVRWEVQCPQVNAFGEVGIVKRLAAA